MKANQLSEMAVMQKTSNLRHLGFEKMCDGDFKSAINLFKQAIDVNDANPDITSMMYHSVCKYELSKAESDKDIRHQMIDEILSMNELIVNRLNKVQKNMPIQEALYEN